MAEKKRSRIAIEGASRLTGFKMPARELVLIGLDTDDGPEHCLYDEHVLEPPTLTNSILEKGVIHPVVGRKNGGRVEVVAGRDRVKSTRAANDILRKRGEEEILVPVILRPEVEDDAFTTMVAENFQRRVVSVMSTARLVQRYLQRGHTREEAAARFRCSKQWVGTLERLLDLDDKVQNAVEAGKISAAAAAGLSKLERKEQVEAMAKLIAAGQTSVADVSRLTQNAAQGQRPRTGAEDNRPRYRIPGRSVIKKAVKVAAEKGKEAGVDPLVVDVFRFMSGQLAPNRIAGLIGLLREVGFDVDGVGGNDAE